MNEKTKVCWEELPTQEIMKSILELLGALGYPRGVHFRLTMGMYWRLRTMLDTNGNYIFGHGVLQIFGYPVEVYGELDEYKLSISGFIVSQKSE